MTKDEKRFYIIRAFAKEYCSEKKVFHLYAKEDLLKRVAAPGLEDAKCLLRMAFKEIDEYNANLSRKCTLIEKLKYNNKYLQSNLLAGISIPLRKIDQLIAENPDKEYYELYRMLSS